MCAKFYIYWSRNKEGVREKIIKLDGYSLLIIRNFVSFVYFTSALPYINVISEIKLIC